MATLKKYSRPITMDGVAYRWRIPPEVSDEQVVHFGRLIVNVWCADTSGEALLLIDGQQPDLRRDGAFEVVTPQRVADAIRTAIAAGWTPTQPGNTFRMPLPPIPRVQEDGTHA